MASINTNAKGSGNKLYINPSHIVSSSTTENKVIWASDIDWGDINVYFNNRTVTSTTDLITIIEELWNAANPNTVAVTGVTINDPKTITLNQGQTGKFTATVSPAGATNKGVTWNSSATGVATVDASGIVTWKGEGTATITVKTNDGGYTATGSVTCNAPAPQATYYWYAGQTQPTSISGTPTVDDENFINNKWHTIGTTLTNINKTSTGGTSGNPWYVAVPKDKYKPTAADFVTPDTSWEIINTISIGSIQYSVYNTNIESARCAAILAVK